MRLLYRDKNLVLRYQTLELRDETVVSEGFCDSFKKTVGTTIRNSCEILIAHCNANMQQQHSKTLGSVYMYVSMKVWHP